VNNARQKPLPRRITSDPTFIKNQLKSSSLEVGYKGLQRFKNTRGEGERRS